LAEQNRHLVEKEIADGTIDVSSFPFTIQFSPEHRCNLRCIMCASTVLRNQGITPLMDVRLPNSTLERFTKLEAYIPYFQTISLNGSGEPLLSPAFPDLLKILSKYPMIAVGFTTHAQVFDRERAELLVKSGVRGITISMDGACKETYERIRVHAKWEKLLRNIDLLNRVKSELQSETPYICFAMNCMRQNIEELPALVDFAHTHGGRSVLATNTLIYDSAMQNEALIHHPELTRRVVIETIRRAQRCGIEFDNRLLDVPEEFGTLVPDVVSGTPQDLSETFHMTPMDTSSGPSSVECTPRPNSQQNCVSQRQGDRPTMEAIDKAPIPEVQTAERADIIKACQMPWTGLMVESDGNVKVCCYNSPYVGNLNNQTFEEIWNGAPIKTLRRSFVEGRPPEGCLNCVIFAKNHERLDSFIQLLPTRVARLENPVEGTTVTGMVDISGWIVDQKQLAKIEVLINDVVMGRAMLGLNRPDVTMAYPKFANCAAPGFSFSADPRTLGNGYCMLSIRICYEDGEKVEIEHRMIEIRNEEARAYGLQVDSHLGRQDREWETLDPDMSFHNEEPAAAQATINRPS
jgi:MoaA/NifB/PqqE/SkfB family radical SAM enzyme